MAISLQKGQKVSLKKTNKSLGKIHINLNWNKKIKNAGILGLFKKDQNIDLDLGCLYELKDGRKGCIQALGYNFGNYEKAPFIELDGDDRTGEKEGGENLYINGDKISEIKRILVYTFIYDGVANWKNTDAIVTIKYPNAEDIIIEMDKSKTSLKLCVLALFENLNDEIMHVSKINHFCESQRYADKAFNWGLNWSHGTK